MDKILELQSEIYIKYNSINEHCRFIHFIHFICSYISINQIKKKNSKNGKNYSTIQWKHYYESWIYEDDVSLLCR
jgi:hypothetical protein